MIEMKSHFGDWQEVSERVAFTRVYDLMNGITTTSDPVKKAAMIDGKHLRGITVDELMKPYGDFICSFGGESPLVGIDYVSKSLGCTVYVQPNTDLGLRERDCMMERIGRMTNYEKSALILRQIAVA